MKCVLLVLSGGASSRMGQPKALLPWGEGTWLEHQLESFGQAGLGSCTVVLHQGLSPLLPESLPAQIILQPDAKKPMADSIRLGLQHHASADLLFLLPVDTPAPSAESWKLMAREALMGRDTWAVLPAEGGHPVGLTAPALAELAASANWRLDYKLREWSEKGRVTRSRALCPHARLNLNRPEEWAAWLEQEGARP